MCKLLVICRLPIALISVKQKLLDLEGSNSVRFPVSGHVTNYSMDIHVLCLHKFKIFDVRLQQNFQLKKLFSVHVAFVVSHKMIIIIILSKHSFCLKRSVNNISKIALF